MATHQGKRRAPKRHQEFNPDPSALFVPEDGTAVGAVNLDGGVLADFAFEDFLCELVDEFPLDQPLDGTGAILRYGAVCRLLPRGLDGNRSVDVPAREPEPAGPVLSYSEKNNDSYCIFKESV